MGPWAQRREDEDIRISRRRWRRRLCRTAVVRWQRRPLRCSWGSPPPAGRPLLLLPVSPSLPPGSSGRRRSARLRRRLVVPACSSGEFSSDAAAAAPKEPTIDIKLPRRSLLVQFTCNACGERTKRLINRVAYERGTIFLQCAGCQVYHKFVDNLGLVVEYDLREEDGIQESMVNTDSED